MRPPTCADRAPRRTAHYTEAVSSSHISTRGNPTTFCEDSISRSLHNGISGLTEGHWENIRRYSRDWAWWSASTAYAIRVRAFAVDSCRRFDALANTGHEPWPCDYPPGKPNLAAIARAADIQVDFQRTRTAIRSIPLMARAQAYADKAGRS